MIYWFAILWLPLIAPSEDLCNCTDPFPAYTASEYSLELFNRYPRILTVKVDSLAESRDTVPIEQIFVSTLLEVKSGSKQRFTVSTYSHHPCSSLVPPSRIGDTMIIFTDQLKVDDIFLAPCSLWSFISQTGFYKQRSQFLSEFYSPTDNQHPITHFSNGNITGTGKYDKKARPVGYWRYFTWDGELKSEGEYTKGLKTGTWTEYLYKEDINNKNMRYLPMGYRIGEYKVNAAAGIWTYYDIHGQKTAEVNMEEETMHN